MPEPRTLVGFPSLNAALAGGPLSSSSLSSCRPATSGTRTHSRRGVPHTRTGPWLNRSRDKSAGTDARSCTHKHKSGSFLVCVLSGDQMLAAPRTSNSVDLLVRQYGRLCPSNCTQNATGRLTEVAYTFRLISNSVSFRITSIRPNAINNKKEQEDKQPHRLCHTAEAVFVQGVTPAEFRPPRPAAAAPPTQSPAPACGARRPSTPMCWPQAAAPAALAPPPGDARGWPGFRPTTWSTLEQDWDTAKGMWVDLALELNLDCQLSSSGSLMHEVVGCSL